MGPREGFPWFGKNLSLTGQAGTPEAFPDTPMPLPYGFLVLSSQRVVRAGDQALFFPPRALTHWPRGRHPHPLSLPSA